VVVKRPVAVVGVGQTKHSARRAEVNIAGWCEAVDRALLDAGLEHKDIDAIVIGKAPDMLEGVMQPEQFLIGAIGGHLKPVVRIHTAGSVGATTALAGVTHVASGLFDRVLVIAFEKQSEGNAMWALSPNMPFMPPLVAGAGGYFAPFVRAYIARTGAPPHIGPMTAANARANAGRNEYAHLTEPMTVEDVMESPVLWDPIRYLETCPSSDGAVAMVLASEEQRQERAAQARVGEGRRVVRRGDVGAGTRSGESARRPHLRQACLCAGRHHRSVDPDRHRRDLRPVRLVRGDVAREPGLPPDRRRLEGGGEGRAEDGRPPAHQSRPAACSAPTRSARPACFALPKPRLQVMGRAGAHQVEGAKTALGHAYGGGAQYFAMWVVGSEL
jgi:acetyl-CoA C-acetyltransferase